jgi:hypothetical protein
MATIRGGEKFEAAMADLARRLGRPATLNVGVLAGATYPNGTPVALAAAILEYGAPANNQPPRPAIRHMVSQKQGEWPEAIAGVLQAQSGDVEKALNIAGEAIAGQWRQAIVNLDSPPLAASTIAKKGFDKVGVDTGHYLKSISYEVKVT